ncbi:hypothetical protein MCEMSHM24_02700 [Comamonadaceae bacterium]
MPPKQTTAEQDTTTADAAATAAAQPAERTPMAEPEGGWPADEFTGKGGSYVRDPYTGIRTPVDPAA